MLLVWEIFPVLHVILRFNMNHQICFLFFSCTYLSQIPHTSGHTKCDENRNSGPVFFLCLSKVHPCTHKEKNKGTHTYLSMKCIFCTRASVCMCVNVLLLRTATCSHVYTQKHDTTTSTCKYTYTTRWRRSWCVCVHDVCTCLCVCQFPPVTGIVKSFLCMKYMTTLQTNRLTMELKLINKIDRFTNRVWFPDQRLLHFDERR